MKKKCRAVKNPSSVSTGSNEESTPKDNEVLVPSNSALPTFSIFRPRWRAVERVPKGLDINQDIHNDMFNMKHVPNLNEMRSERPTSPEASSAGGIGRPMVLPMERLEDFVEGTIKLPDMRAFKTTGNIGESAVLDPSLLEKSSRELCYAVPPEFRVETMNAYASFFVMLTSYLLPVGSFVLDMAYLVPDTGRQACIGYTVARAILFASLGLAASIFALTYWKVHRNFAGWLPEQFYIFFALQVLVFENGKQLYKLAVREEFCENDFSVSDHSDVRFLRILNFAFTYFMLDVFHTFRINAGAIIFVFFVGAGEFVFLWEFPTPKHDDSRRSFVYNAEQWFETMRIFFLAHKAYLGYMELSRRSYLRTRARQLAFWIITGPFAVECFIKLCGKQLVNLYNLYEGQDLNTNSFVGQVCVNEIKFLLLAYTFATPGPKQVQRTEPIVRVVRLEAPHGERPLSGKEAQSRLKRRRGNIFSYFGLEPHIRGQGDTLRPTFSLETAVWAFNCSYLVYFEPPDSDLPNKMPPEDLETSCVKIRKFAQDIPSSASSCIFFDVLEPSRIFVAFRGTASLSDVATDITAWAKLVDFGGDGANKFWVHQGFNKAYKTIGAMIRMELHTYIRELIMSGTPAETISITFCGHSLGGALATLMAVASADGLNQVGVSNIKLYTLGSPRVGDMDFAAYASSKISHIFRLVGRGDPVPRVPGKKSGWLLMCVGLPIYLKLGSWISNTEKRVLLHYKHVGYEVVLNRFNVGDLIVEPMPAESHFYFSWIPAGKYHLVDAYRSALLASVFQFKGEDDPAILKTRFMPSKIAAPIDTE